ncbi:putative protein in type-1 retrotransposable element R1DM [Portunus trituberculatus]|uniref:Uncharacterized protein n=1 Tax=Portunus trituberculatus TaxID=210409 RepID=A0A5B7G2Q8_PORTR|nr:putative protein in type-1 retrotransposable element R1DM [Portunus trituberculatus]
MGEKSAEGEQKAKAQWSRFWKQDLVEIDGSTVTSSTDKATLLAEYFANKMMVDDPARPAPQLAQETDNTVTTVLVTEEQVERLLRAVDESKATVLWNIYIDDLLHQLSSVAAFADDCTLSRSYCRLDSQRAVNELNRQLRMVEQWGEVWQVNFAPKKTQAMVISRSPDASHVVSGELRFGGKCLPFQDYIKILGVCVDRSLRFDHHIAGIARQTSLRVSALRRMADTLDPRGTLTLHKALIRPCMEYGALSWMSSAAVHMQRLDDVQRQTLRLVTTEEEEQHPAPLTSLEHRRDVSALVVSHLIPLRLQPHTAQRCTRDAARSDELV